MDLDPKQQDAVDLISTGRIGIITGGPGTGKTTCLRVALERLRTQGKHVALMAPTGKAARRMSQACSYPAETIHRALGYNQGLWGHNVECPYPADVVIVDEASMLDTTIGAVLLNAIDERRTSLFFVGDANQLPSVGAGNVLADLMALEDVPLVRLETLHRAAQASWMNRNAPRILAGDMINLELDSAPDFRYVRTDEPERLAKVIEQELNTVQELVGTALTMEEALTETQVLIPQKKGPLGVHSVNRMLQAAVQGGDMKRSEGWQLPDESYLYAGDKVMQMKNNYVLDLMNGEQGIVAGVHEGRDLVVDIEGESYRYNKEASWALQLAYASTVHKSQGSEWPLVIVVCHTSHGRMLYRQLLYTAVTRAKKRVVIVGDDDGIGRAVRTSHVQERQTGLQQAVLAAIGG